MLGALQEYGRVFIEITSLDHEHGGPGWEFGTCLWSPTRNTADQDRYALMREPQPGHLVLHMAKRDWEGKRREFRLVGMSIVTTPCQTLQNAPPIPGVWADRPEYYRVDLEGYQTLATPIRIPAFLAAHEQQIRAEYATRPSGYPFSGQELQVTEGLYLRECSPALFELLRQEINPDLAEIPVDIPEGVAADEFVETRRRAAERSYFARNPTLVRRARAQYGPCCAACGDDPSERYGALGAEMTECHHKRVLGEQGHSVGAVWVTRLDNICLLCPNCHRAIHRRRPAYSLDELRAMLIPH